MTIDEAISHLRDIIPDLCDECKKEHEQLLEWLIELKKFRETEK